jgi:hypothetical protein
LDALSAGFDFQWRDAAVTRASTGDEGLDLFFERTPDGGFAAEARHWSRPRPI